VLDAASVSVLLRVDVQREHLLYADRHVISLALTASYVAMKTHYNTHSIQNYTRYHRIIVSTNLVE